jgi:hypothetical protein
MNEPDVMARLAAANPVWPAEMDDAARSSRAQFLLRSVLARPRARRSRLPHALIPAALAAAVAVAVAVVSVPRTQPEPPPPAPAVTTPRTVLFAAADLAARQKQPAQFVHVAGTVGRIVHLGPGSGYNVIRVDSVRSVQPANGLPGEGWLTVGEGGSSVRPLTAADAAAYAKHGSPGAAKVPKPGAGQGLYPDLAGDSDFEGDVADLPGDPAETGTAMLATVPAPPDPQGWLFRQGTRLLDTFTDVIGGDQRAKIFRMLAGLTAVRTLDEKADPLGRPALGLAYTERTTRYGLIDWQIFVGAGSDQITYTQAVVRQPGPANASLTPGAVQYSTAITSVTWSDKP